MLFPLFGVSIDNVAFQDGIDASNLLLHHVLEPRAHVRLQDDLGADALLRQDERGVANDGA